MKLRRHQTEKILQFTYIVLLLFKVLSRKIPARPWSDRLNKLNTFPLRDKKSLSSFKSS